MIRDHSTTYRGRWWLASDDTRKFDGTLTLDDHSGGELVLDGTTQAFVDAGLGGQIQKTMTFHAEVDVHYTYKITLFDVGFIRGPSYGNNKQMPTTVTLFTNSFVIGDHVNSPNDKVVSRARLNLGGLSEFVDTTHIGVKWKPPQHHDSDKLAINVSSRATGWIALNNSMSLRFFSTFIGPRAAIGLKRTSIEIVDYIDLKFHKPISLSKLRDQTSCWQSFLTFSSRKPSYLEEVRFSDDKNSSNHPLQFVIPGERPNKDSTRRNWRELLLTKSRLQKSLRRAIQGWSKVMESAEIPIMLFTGTGYQKGIFVHSQLLATLQAVESLHRDLYDKTHFPDEAARKQAVKHLKKSLPDTLSDDLKQQLNDDLTFIGKVTLRDRLLDFYDRYPKSISALFKNKEEDMSLLKDVRNFLTHYGDKKKFNKQFLESRRIMILSGKVSIFFEICLLGAIGFADEEIKNILQSVDDYAHLKWESHQQ
jgi:hypothetical protein